MPRPEIARLGIKYRRIPVLSIGRDVYLDTRLILQKLEQLHPSLPKLGAEGPDQRALERLLEVFMIDGGMFSRAAQLLPPDLPLLKDPKFQKDRADFTGVDLPSRTAARLRPEALNEIERAMGLLETTLLADGREWVLQTEGPTLADIEAVWLFHWLTGLPGALPENQISARRFPKLYAWVGRFQKAISAAKARQAKPRTLSGEEAQEAILSSPFNEEEGRVDDADALVRFEGFRKGQEVQLWPTDTGTGHKDVGKLVSIDGTEIVIEAASGASSLRVHAPRHGFRVRPLAQGAGHL